MRLDYEQIEAEVLHSINEANETRFEIERNFQNIEKLKSSGQNRNFYNDFDNNDDALMISEANEEILDTSMSTSFQTTDVNNNLNVNANKIEELLKVEEGMNEILSLNTIDLKLNQFLCQKFIKCKPEVKNACYGHFSYDSILGKVLIVLLFFLFLIFLFLFF